MVQQMVTYEQECELMDESVLGLLEDLRETISNYQVRSSFLVPLLMLTGTTDGTTNGDLRAKM